MGSLPNMSFLKGPSRTVKPNLTHRLFENAAEKFEKDIALIFEENNVIKNHSYKELNCAANKLAKAIKKSIESTKNYRNSDGDIIVAVSMLPTDQLVITLLAIWKSGAAYLPIDPTFPKSRVEHILREAKPAMVVYENILDFEFSDQILSKPLKLLSAEAENYSTENFDENDCFKHERDNLAIVLYTSGSTGVPKGVRLPHEVILNRLEWQFNTFPYFETEKVCIFKTALTFVDSVSEIWGPLLKGRSVLVVQKIITQNPEKLVTLLEKYQIQRLVLVPSLLRSLLLFLELQQTKTILHNLKIWVCSGESLAISLAQEFFKYFPEVEHILCNFYGSTEVMGDVTYHVISRLEQLKSMDKVPIGIPIDNTIIYLLDENFRPVEINSVGELWVAGLNLAAGYVNGRDPYRFIANPFQTASNSFGKLYKTGDYARIDQGIIIYEGRTDSQVKIRGHRVDLSEVERAVNLIENIEKAVVLCYHAGEIDQALLAFVTLQNDSLMNEMQIENMLQKKLASYMLPQVVILEKIPLLVNGKTDRQSLLKSYENTNNNDDNLIQTEIDYTGVPDYQMSAAKVLLETIASVLNRSARGAIRIDANFYEIGGNSLNSIFTITKLNEQGYYISIGDFIGAQDLQEVLNHLSPEKIILPPSQDTVRYSCEMLDSKHREDVFNMIRDSFYEKADLEQWLMPDIYKEDYSELLDQMWDDLVKQDLSFVAKTDGGKTAGVALNMDARDEPEVEIHSKLGIIFEFLEDIEAPVRDHDLPQGKGTIFHSNMMATNSTLTAKENVSVMQYMEEEVLRIARNRHFAGILTTNTSALTQQLGVNVYGYQSLSDIQVNQYIASDGLKPFGEAPDSQRAVVCWKPI